MPIPLPKCFWPLRITAGVNDKLDFTSGGFPYFATIAAGLYYSPETLAAAVQAALNATGVPATPFTVSVSPTGRFVIAGSAIFGMPGSGGAHWSSTILTLLGFDASAPGTSDTYTSPRQHANGWYSPDPVKDDTGDLGSFVRSQAVAPGGACRSLDWGGGDVRTVSLVYVPADKSFIADEVGGAPSLERLFRDGWTRFRWWPDASAPATWKDYSLDIETARQMPRRRLSPDNALYDFTLRMRPIVP